MTNLKQKTLNGLLWSSIERFSIQGIQFVLGITIARFLLPSDYGLIGMIAIFMSISQALIDSGFSQALIQKKEVTEKDYSTIFYFNIITAIGIYAILYSLAQPIAIYYNEPTLLKLIRVIGLSIIFNSFSIVQLAKLSKNIDFKTQSKASLSAVIFSGSIALYLASNGFGVWALAIQQILRSSTNTILLFIFTKWKPQLIFSKKSFNSLFPFGSKLLLSGLLNAVFNNLYLIVIGKVYNKDLLGLYTRANQFQLLPSETITIVLQRVTFPILSSIQDEQEKLTRLYKKFICFAGFIIFPIMIGIAVIAKPLIIILLKTKWIGVVEYLQLIVFVGVLYPIHAINLNILKVKGRSDLFLRLEIIKKALILLTLLITYSYGIKIMIIGQIITSIIALYINTHYSKKMIDYGFINQIKDLFPFFITAVIMGIIIHFSIKFIDYNILKLITASIIGPISYYSLSKLLKFEEIIEINNLFNRIKSKF